MPGNELVRVRADDIRAGNERRERGVRSSDEAGTPRCKLVDEPPSNDDVELDNGTSASSLLDVVNDGPRANGEDIIGVGISDTDTLRDRRCERGG
jgi:hypothetical protein